jgi:sterol desaturase/sphingolipid hydroxylase (fatty acid hydroxylase superfamily)
VSYDWKAAAVFIGLWIALSLLLRLGIAQVPALRRMAELNDEVDRKKLARERFRKAVEVNKRAGLITNLVFYAAILPFSVSLEPRPLWRHALDMLAVMLVFDFFYYLTHRFLFHGRPLRRVHALHHQAHQPTHIDAFFVHPLETVIGLGLFLLSIPLIAALSGAPLHAASMALATLIFTQINTLNHVYVNLPYFPFRTITWVTQIHAAHHVDMSRGNYATLTTIYDWLLGTLEKPVGRATP